MKNNPFEIFADWFEEAKKTAMKEPTAMNLATATKDGLPSSRIVLLKAFDEKGFVFYTNANSRKGKELFANPHAALNFYWMELQKQVRIEGDIEVVKGKDADDYYNSRALERRHGAWASKQSEVMNSRDDLVNAIEEVKKKYGNNPPRPEFWHGFRVKPKRIEFWQEGAHRLHQRDIYEFKNGSWNHFVIYP